MTNVKTLISEESRDVKRADRIRCQEARQHFRGISGKSDFKTKKEINSFVDSLNDTQLYRYHLPAFTMEKDLPVVEEILKLARHIRSYDSNFKNLNSEREAATVAAGEMVKVYYEIMKLLPEVPEEKAAIVIEGLKVTNHMYLRVLGDRLSSFKEDGLYVNFEDRIKTLYCDKIIVNKQKRFTIRQTLLNQKIEKDLSLETYMGIDSKSQRGSL